MKIITSIIFLLSAISGQSRTLPVDTTLKGVSVNFRYSVSIFPGSWQVAPINAQGKQIAASEIERSKLVMTKAFSKYPAALLQKELQAVYLLTSMKFYDVEYGGTNSTDALYLTNNGISMGYTDLYLEQTFHHEFSSILYRNHPLFLDESAWIQTNMPRITYNDPENGVGAIRNKQSSQDLDTNLCKKGFLTQYALSGMENDINTFAQNIFSPYPGFWAIVDKYPRINKKAKLLIAFYNKIDPQFTETYFRNLIP